MNYISTIDFRRNTSKIMDLLKEGKSTYIVHRSKVVGKIIPQKTEEIKLFDPKILENIKLPQKDISYKKREQIKQKHIKEKYGKNIS